MMTTELQIPYYDQWLGPWAILPDALTQTLELFRKTDLHIHLQQQAARNGDWLLLPERPEGCFAQKGPVTFWRTGNRNTGARHVAAAAIETHTPDYLLGSWCNRQHGGLLIRTVWVRFPPALLALARSSAVRAGAL